jgi:hypothetical protein
MTNPILSVHIKIPEILHITCQVCPARRTRGNQAKSRLKGNYSILLNKPKRDVRQDKKNT